MKRYKVYAKKNGKWLLVGFLVEKEDKFVISFMVFDKVFLAFKNSKENMEKIIKQV